MDKKVCLLVLFNHRYDKNLSLLDAIYKDRFSYVYYLVPFYDGERDDVIPVYGRSVFFELYIAQAYSLLKDRSFDYYYIVADDMVINPMINEDNILDFFELKCGESWIPHLRLIRDQKQFWLGTMAAFLYKPTQKYVETQNELPSIENALKKFENQGLYQPMKLLRKDIFREFSIKTEYLADKARLALRVLTRIKHPFQKRADLSYPLAASYSDTVLVSGRIMPRFAHYCGVFGATSLFVEVAIPTALVLASDAKIKTEKDITKSGRSYWKTPDNVFCESPEYTWDNLDKEFKSLDDMIKHFPMDAIYIHPVKLSKWIKK